MTRTEKNSKKNLPNNYRKFTENDGKFLENS